MFAFGFRQLIGLFIWGKQSDYPCCTFLIQSVSKQQMGSIEDTHALLSYRASDQRRTSWTPGSSCFCAMFREADEWSPLPSAYRPI